MKDISSNPPLGRRSHGRRLPNGNIVIEVPRNAEEPDYPKAIFACDTLEEALTLCKKMNIEAGYERYGVQKPAKPQKETI